MTPSRSLPTAARRPHTALRLALAGALTGALLAALPASAGASDLFVTPEGTGDCHTGTSPCRLADALAVVSSGDRILLGPGIHAPSTSLQDRAGVSGVSIESMPGDSRPVLDISGAPLKLTNGTGLSGIDVISGAGRALVSTGGLLDGLRVQVSGTNTVGVELGDGAVLRNSTVTAAGERTTAISVTAADAPAEVRGVTTTADGNDAAALRVAPSYPRTTSSVRVVNAIVRGIGFGKPVVATAQLPAVAAVALDHVATDPTRLVATGDGAAISQRSTLSAVPLFVNRANGDLRQTAASPTIDAGTTDIDGDGVSDDGDLLAGGVFDLDGSPRRLGLPDIGADEREMPPIVQQTTPQFGQFAASAQVEVQPRGLVSNVAVEWGFDERPRVTTTTVQASGNAPVVLAIPLDKVPVGAGILHLKVRASSSAGVTYGAPLEVPVPVEQQPEPTAGTESDEQSSPIVVVTVPAAAEKAATRTSPTPRPVATPKPTVTLPGALPTLLTDQTAQARGMFAFRLRCRHSVSCRGSVLLTRLGQTRRAPFKIPPGAERTVRLSLNSGQAARVRNAGERGLRGLLEVRSNDDGSSWSAVRLFSSRWG